VREARLSDKAAVANLLGQLAETIEDWPFERDRLSRGVGRRLVEEAIQVARARGACELEVSTEKTNRAAQAFYRRLGFSHEAVLMELEFEGEE
ncbi:MAG TPA: GNAT family N-acetyltransferase, partial [Anaerolineae bacterium]|nr:GNAT family N-acetyltransferase [Anaerolineae bacterium]